MASVSAREMCDNAGPEQGAPRLHLTSGGCLQASSPASGGCLLLGLSQSTSPNCPGACPLARPASARVMWCQKSSCEFEAAPRGRAFTSLALVVVGATQPSLDEPSL